MKKEKSKWIELKSTGLQLGRGQTKVRRGSVQAKYMRSAGVKRLYIAYAEGSSGVKNFLSQKVHLRPIYIIGIYILSVCLLYTKSEISNYFNQKIATGRNIS